MENIASARDLVGQVLNDRYEVVELLHTGTASSIYKGVHRLMTRTVAIKLLSPDRCFDGVSIKRFQQEAQVASHLSHPGAVTVYDYGFVAQGVPYLVMDYLQGVTLTELVSGEGPLNVERFRNLFLKLSKTVAYIHEKGVFHRDLKPSHFIITRYNPDTDMTNRPNNLAIQKGDEMPVIVDFNISLLHLSSGKKSFDLDEPGAVIGTPHYMSPEQCMAGEIDERSDIYSMGCSMYYALTGSPPFQGARAIDTLQMHMNSQPDADRLPDELKDIVIRTLRKNPDDRFQSMDQLAVALC